jgi:hypothetical protein
MQKRIKRDHRVRARITGKYNAFESAYLFSAELGAAKFLNAAF